MPPERRPADSLEDADAGTEDAREAEFDAADDEGPDLGEADVAEDADDRGEEVDDAEGDGLETDEPVKPRRKQAPAADPAEIERRVRAEAERDFLQRRTAELESGYSAANAAAEAEREAAAVRLMQPEEVARYYADKAKRETQQAMNRLAHQFGDTTDKAEFRALCRESPAIAKIAPEVETRLADLRRQGSNVSREIMAKQILGERAMKRLTSTPANDKASARAARVRERERSNGAAPVSGRPGDRVRRAGGDERTQRARRLENVQL